MLWIESGGGGGGRCMAVASIFFKRNAHVLSQYQCPYRCQNGTMQHDGFKRYPIYYPPAVRRGEYWGLGVFLLLPLVNVWKLLHLNCININVVG